MNIRRHVIHQRRILVYYNGYAYACLPFFSPSSGNIKSKSSPSSPSSDLCSIITQASLSSPLHAPTFTSSFDNQMTGNCTICCSLLPAAVFWLATCTPCTSSTCSQQPWASSFQPAIRYQQHLPARVSAIAGAMLPLRPPLWAPVCCMGTATGRHRANQG